MRQTYTEGHHAEIGHKRTGATSDMLYVYLFVASEPRHGCARVITVLSSEGGLNMHYRKNPRGFVRSLPVTSSHLPRPVAVFQRPSASRTRQRARLLQLLLGYAVPTLGQESCVGVVGRDGIGP